jgi:hypothetical protein
MYGTSNIKTNQYVFFLHGENMLLPNSVIRVLNTIVLYGINNWDIIFKNTIKTKLVATSDCVIKFKMWVSRFDVVKYQLLFVHVHKLLI